LNAKGWATRLIFLNIASGGLGVAAEGPEAVGLGRAIVSAGTKKAAAEGLKDTLLPAAQRAVVKRAIGRATLTEKVSVERLADGSIRVLRSRPGVDGSQVFSTIIDAGGNTRTVQVGVSATGAITHYDPK